MRILISIVATVLFHLSINAQSYIQSQKIVPSDRGFVDFFGSGGAISGDYAIIGAYREDEDENGLNTLSSAGSAYIFERDTNGIWHEVQKIVASDRAKNAFFGWNVAIDSNIAVVGAFGDENDAFGGPKLGRAGSAYVYRRDINGVWQEIQKINAADREFSDDFAVRVEICGTTILVGAQREDENENAVSPLTDAGSAYIFEPNASGVWTQVQKIVASDRRAHDFFGTSISISEHNIIVGAYRQDYDSVGSVKLDDAGAAYIFAKDSSGLWMETAKVTAPDREEEDRFGSSVFVSGNYALVGAVSEDHDENGANFVLSAGSAYMFENNAFGEWVFMKKIVAPIRNTSDLFGASLWIEGETAVISALYSDEQSDSGVLIDAGAVYIYNRDDQNDWALSQKLNHSDIDADDQFGWKCILSGETIMITANEENDDVSGQNSIAEAGSAYFFQLDNSCLEPSVLNSDPSFESTSLSWESATNALGYTLRGTKLGLDSNSYTYINVSQPMLNVSGLEQASSYLWQVRSNCSETNSAYSQIDTFTTLEYLCSSPQNLSVTAITETSAQLNWDPVPSAVNYVIRGSANVYDKNNLVFVTTTNNFKSVGGLSAGTVYHWQVQAVCNNSPTPVSAFSSINVFATNALALKENGAGAMNVFPNPSSSDILIQATFMEGPVQLNIYDMLGQKLYQEEMNSTIVDKNLTLPSGSYLIELVSINIAHHKLVIIE
ncbi:MAG: T9SS type A sorting domain-containing protein [Chitinophagales bacterium]|nr:T9SS type A sorting domain-containing protein [Chitinophagales bacterium]